jgi:hypothetical protein
MTRRPLVVLALAAVAAAVPITVHVAAPAAAHRAAFPATYSCGYDRWTVKTLQDRPQLLPTTSSTVSALGALRQPALLPSTRLPQEHQVFVVTADVIAINRQTDGDLHVILSAGGRTIISEAPKPACTTDATPFRRLQMEHARDSVRICHASVTGVLFFDLAAGQYGHSPNYAELHPLLVFQCLPTLSARPRLQDPLSRLAPWGAD